MGTVMIVGGGCSFGRELVGALSEHFDELILTEHVGRLDTMDEAKRACKAGVRIREFTMDVTDTDSIARVFAELDEDGCELDALVYCAGINALQNALEVTPKLWDMILNINLRGFFFCARQAAANMICHDKKGSIVAVSSQHSVVVSKDRAPYCASKAGLTQVAKEMALEFAPSGIVVNTIAPTFIESDSNTAFLRSASAKRNYLAKIPIGRYASAYDVVKAILFLICGNTFITGQNLLVDGGYSIQ